MAANRDPVYPVHHKTEAGMGGSFTINRRSFVGGLGLAAVAPSSLQAAPVTARFSAYAGESGKFGTWPRVIGVLITTRPAVHAARIEMLRRRAGYRRELLYTSTDRRKAPFAEALIDYFAAEPDLRFTGVVVRTANDDFDNLRRNILKTLIGGAALRPSSGSNLDQVVRFLAGCVHGKATGVSHPLKAGLIALLENRTATANRVASAHEEHFSVAMV